MEHLPFIQKIKNSLEFLNKFWAKIKKYAIVGFEGSPQNKALIKTNR